MSFWLLYLMTRTEDIGDTASLLAIFCILGGAFGYFMTTAIAAGDADDDGTKIAKSMKPVSKGVLIFGLIACLVSGLMPSKEDWYLIVGGYYVTHIEGIDKLPPNGVAAMNEFLEEYAKGDKTPAKHVEGKSL